MAELRKGSSKLGSPETARLPDHAFKFDLKTDPGEKHDRKVEHPEGLAELRRKYTKWEGEMLKPIPLEVDRPQSRH